VICHSASLFATKPIQNPRSCESHGLGQSYERTKTSMWLNSMISDCPKIKNFRFYFRTERTKFPRWTAPKVTRDRFYFTILSATKNILHKGQLYLQHLFVWFVRPSWTLKIEISPKLIIDINTKTPPLVWEYYDGRSFAVVITYLAFWYSRRANESKNRSREKSVNETINKRILLFVVYDPWLTLCRRSAAGEIHGTELFEKPDDKARAEPRKFSSQFTPDL